MYVLCSRDRRGTRPSLAAVVSVGNCGISAAYRLFDFPREWRSQPGVRLGWSPKITADAARLENEGSSQIDSSQMDRIEHMTFASPQHTCTRCLTPAGSARELFMSELEKRGNRTIEKAVPCGKEGPTPGRVHAHWPFPTTSRHLGGSHPCVAALLNQRLNGQVVPEVGCHHRGISKAHAPLSKRNNATIVSGHKCLFGFKRRFG